MKAKPSAKQAAKIVAARMKNRSINSVARSIAEAGIAKFHFDRYMPSAYFQSIIDKAKQSGRDVKTYELRTITHGWHKPALAPHADLVVTSPPYENSRTYGIRSEFVLATGQEWAMQHACMIRCYLTSGIKTIAYVVSGVTRHYEYSLAPERLAVACQDLRMCVRRPLVYKRFGIPGSGGPDYFRADHEPIIVVTARGKMQWSDVTACGSPPKFPVGGNPSSRKRNGSRVSGRAFKQPAKTNPGSIIDCGAVGGGHLGHPLAHRNEAPYPVALPDRFIRSFCPPNGTVFDPFSGSGTTLHAAMLAGRNGFGFDARQEQTIVALHRLIDVANEVVQDNQVVLINADGIIVSIDKEHGVSTIIGGPIPEIPK
jgi:hypothetical protein